MKSYKSIPIIIFFIFMSLTSFTMTEYQGLTIKEIKFEGLRFFTETSLRDNLQNSVGQKFSVFYAEKDFKRLYGIGAFKEIVMFVQKTQDEQIILTFKISEYPKIDKLVFEGVDKLSESDLSDVMRLREDTHYNPAFIERDRKAILKIYEEKGFLNTRVTFNLEETTKPGFVILKVILNEGEKILIEQVRITGTKQLDPSDIKRFMESLETTLVEGDQTYTETKKRNDIMRILSYARWKGFIFARVLRYDVRIDWIDPEFKDKRGYYIEVEIEEGDRYAMGKIDFEGNELYTKRELNQLVKTKQGEVYNELDFTQSLQAIYDAYRTQGYIYTKITVIEKYDRQNKVVNFVFNIFDGDRAHIETIIFRGNTKTKSYVLDRELRIWEGEVFNITRINLSKERLNRLGFFKTVEMDIRPSSEEGLIDLIFTVEPQRTGMISFGGGYGSLSGFTVFSEVTENNFLGRGYKISARGEYGQKAREIKLSWASRYLTDYLPISYGFAVGLRWSKRQIQPFYDRNNDGIPDKIVYDTSGNFKLVQSVERAQSAGFSPTPQPGMTINNPYTGAPVTYDLSYVSDSQWLGLYDYDANGDGVLTPGVDWISDERWYKEYTLFGRLSYGYSFANYFHIFSGYSLSATKLFGINTSSANTFFANYDTSSGAITSPSAISWIFAPNLYEETRGAKTSFRNALTKENWLLTSKIPVGFTFDNTDHNFNPTKGLSFTATWSFVGIGGDVKYNEFTVETNFYVPLPFKLVWANRVGLGIIMHWFNQDKPLVLEGNKLSFDGINEARGWQDYVYLDRYLGYGRVVLSTELRWPIIGTSEILWWVFFFDVGGINKDLKGGKLPTDLENEYIYSWGFGLRIQIPMFPIRLYGAQRLLYKNGRLRPAGKGLEFVFSIAGYF